MLGEVYSKLVSYFIAAIAMFIVPIIIINVRLNASVQDYVQDKTVEFVDSCRATGYISPENYKLLNKKLGSFGAYQIKLTHEKLLSYADETQKGAYSDHYMYITNDEILEYMYPETGADRNYYMKQDDRIIVNVKSLNQTLGGKYLFAFTGLTEQPIAVNYGGLVGNTTGHINE